ncbi:MAG: peptide ABC transporter substrate-binding protein [Patescibacteria group bacterium]
MDFDSYSEKTRDIKTTLTRHRVVSHFSMLENALKSFSPGERLILNILTIILSLSAFALLARANALTSVIIPSRGGSLTEGVEGSARFLNPLLALSEGDKSITALVYSGLMRAMPDGSLIPDLAERVDISEDGMTYTFTLRPNLTFHDGELLTSEDILFTIQWAQNPDIKSGRRADWEGVSVTAEDARTIIFKLPHAYAPSLENATLGILPKHLWETVSAEEFPFAIQNTHPIGSGPYKIDGFDTDSTGIATSYELSPFKDFVLGQAYVNKIRFNFYPNEKDLIDAFNVSRIDSIAGISPSQIDKLSRKDSSMIQVTLPRVFGVFFNQNKNAAFADVAVRSALDEAINKQGIVDEIFNGYGTVLKGPVPPGFLGTVRPATSKAVEDTRINEPASDNSENAREILSQNGWKFDAQKQVWTKKGVVLQFTLATVDEPELAATAETIAKSWRKAGIKVDVHVYPISELNSVLIRPRNYDALLFGEVVGRTLDLFAFWHSSQRNDPGLNIALYTNIKADSLLEKARSTANKRAREKFYEKFTEYVAEDKPAIFLYAPNFIYIVPKNLYGVTLGTLTSPSDRFLNAHQWYTDTERVWNIFTDKNEE